MVSLREQCEIARIITILLLFVISFLWMCVYGFCTPEWLLPNIILGCIGEILLCYILVRHIRRSAMKFKGSRVKDFYERIFTFYLLVMLFGIVWLLDASRSTGSASGFGFSSNIIAIALIFLVWMIIEIHKINKQKKKWTIKKAIGIAITFFLKI